MQYLAYRFKVNPPQPGSEILMALISEFEFSTFENTEDGFVAYIDEKDASLVNFNELIFEDFTYSYQIEKIAQTNWNAEWEKNFEPVKIDSLLLIRAPFHPSDKTVKHEIVIMPKMSFGTGHHQTTQLMCAAMFEQNFKNARVLDMGSGTGILAILAKKLGANDILAIDIDEWSVENCIENCTNNDSANVIVKKGDVDLIENQKPFDFILANINKNILKSHLKSYSAKLNPGGKLFLSGFFKTDVEDLSSLALIQNLKLEIRNSKEEWAMMVLEKI